MFGVGGAKSSFYLDKHQVHYALESTAYPRGLMFRNEGHVPTSNHFMPGARARSVCTGTVGPAGED